MKILETIGMDMSKLTFDVRIHSSQMHETFDNTTQGFGMMMNWVNKHTSCPKEQILFAFEHTGLYSHQIAVFLSKQELPFVMIPGLEIKRSMGIKRGKDDQIDAAKIALYAYRMREELKLAELPTEAIMSLKRLLSLRERLVKQRAGYQVSLKEQKSIFVKKDNKVLFEVQQKMIACLSKQMKQVEQEINRIVSENENLKKSFDLIVSIKGVGPQTALQLIVHTQNFTKFKNVRKFASYCGIAPFPHSSGTSLRGTSKISHLANKKIKSLLDMCAKTSIQYNAELKQYYERRLKEGKNKRSTINIIRNKLSARIFAVVQRQTPYVDTMKYVS